MTAKARPAETPPMKSFRLPGGRRVWNAAGARLDTRFLYREMFVRRSYEKHGIAIRPGDTIFDVGANIGMFALSLAGRFRDLRIYCFEPVPGTFACLQRNLAEWRLPSGCEIAALNFGLGAAEGQTTIEFFPEAPSNATLYSAEKHRDFAKVLDAVHFRDLWKANRLRALFYLPLYPLRKILLGRLYARMLAAGVSIPCQLRTLSGVLEERRVERIDLLKIDVEGAEMDVLAGIEERHWPLIRQLSMEVEPANKPRVPALLERLRSLGFARIALESIVGGPSHLKDEIACNIYATRVSEPRP
ncbi:MAG TPA: FkbM family methyltransferase [Bryobacteraceae bacterium]|nr:FkbM family methyltransferase [Bryobacteraceae bacterium]